MKSTILSLLLLLAAPLSLFPQWITHHDPVYQGTVQKPQRLGTFIDPHFTTSVTRLTDARTESIPGIVPNYSRRQAWNADETRLLLFRTDGDALLYDGQSYQFITQLDGVDGEDVFWHPTDPYSIYHCGDSVLYSTNISTAHRATVHVFEDYTWANTRGEGNLSNDGRYWAFVGQVYDYGTGEVSLRDIVVYDLVQDSVVAKMALPQQLQDFDWVSISPLGNYVVVDYATSESGRYDGVEVYDRAMNFLWQRPLGAGHSDLGIDANGDEVIVIDIYDGNTNEIHFEKYRLSDAQHTRLLSTSPHFDQHISCRNERRREWCVISTYDYVTRLTDDSASWLPFEDEIFALSMDGSGGVERIAHHRSRRFSPLTPDPDNSNYFAEPHATVSRNGDRVLWASNWRIDVALDSGVDTYIADFRDKVGTRVESVSTTGPFRLDCHPNPFRDETLVSFTLTSASDVRLAIVDALGREKAPVLHERMEAGAHQQTIDTSRWSNGIYFVHLLTGSGTITKKMVRLK